MFSFHYHLLRIALHDHPVVNHLVHGEHDHLHVVAQGLLVHVLPQDPGHGVEQTVQDCHQQQLVLLARTDHIEEEVHAGLVQAGQAIQHDNFCIGLQVCCSITVLAII